MNLAVFGATQVLDIVTTAYGLQSGLAEGSPVARALMPGGNLLPWAVAKLLLVLLVGSLAAFVFAHRFGAPIRVAVGLIIAALSAVTLTVAVQNLVLAAG